MLETQEANMAKIDLPDDVLRQLGELAKPFVEKEPADVIRRLIAERSAKDAKAKESETIYSTVTPPDLSFTKVIAAKLNGIALPQPNWNRMMDHVIRLAAKKVRDSDSLSKIILAKHVKGEKKDQGFQHFPEAKLSVQGQDANNAWKTTAHILKELGYSAEVTFMWGNNPKAVNPGQAGKFVIGA